MAGMAMEYLPRVQLNTDSTVEMARQLRAAPIGTLCTGEGIATYRKDAVNLWTLTDLNGRRHSSPTRTDSDYRWNGPRYLHLPANPTEEKDMKTIDCGAFQLSEFENTLKAAPAGSRMVNKTTPVVLIKKSTGLWESEDGRDARNSKFTNWTRSQWRLELAEDELGTLKAAVVAKARELATLHGWCKVVEQDFLQALDLVPKPTQSFTITVTVPDTGTPPLASLKHDIAEMLNNQFSDPKVEIGEITRSSTGSPPEPDPF